MVHFIPPYFHYRKTAAFYDSLNADTSPELTISFERCVWVDHFELQKLATVLAGLEKHRTLAVKTIPPSDHTVAEVFKGSVAANAYANRVRFFAFLSQLLKSRLTVLVGRRVLNSERHDDIESEIDRLLPLEMLGTQTRLSFIPLTPITDLVSVDKITTRFATGDKIQSLLSYYSTLDFVESGELATLIVNELAHNIVEHAWPIHHNSAPSACISLTSVDFGARSRPTSRYSTRLRWAPLYERDFIRTTTSPGYLELCVSDNGCGIPDSLRSSTSFDSLSERLRPGDPSDAVLLAASFWDTTTRDPGPHRPGLRGLFYVFESVRENQGAISCQSGGNELVIVCGGQAWTDDYARRDPLAPTNPADTRRLFPPCPGTHLRILLPLVPRKSRRHYWQIRLQTPLADLASKVKPSLPQVLVSPAAPPLAMSVREAMAEFRRECRSTLGDLDGVWLSACRTRPWRKQHMQMLLGEFLEHPGIRSMCIVNIPSSQFVTLLLVARHFDPLAHGKVLLLLDEQGRLGIVFKDQADLCQRFMKWASGAERVLSFGESAEAKALDAFAAEFEQRSLGISVCEMLLAIMRAGIDTEFRHILSDYKNSDVVAKLDDNTYIQDWIEFDEALRESAYLRWIAAYMTIWLKFSLRPDGIVVLRRAAERIIGFQSPVEGQFVWSMPTPAAEYLPTSEWLAGRRTLCLITDVVSRGSTVKDLVQQIFTRYAGAQSRPTITVFAPLLIDWILPWRTPASCNLDGPGYHS